MARTALSSGPHDSTSSPANRGNIGRPEAAEGDDARVCPESGGPGGNEASPDPHTDAVHGRAHPPVFEIGIVMAGAISAGAYTAGVMDFLIQALDAWQRIKDSGKDVDCPCHDVKLCKRRSPMSNEDHCFGICRADHVKTGGCGLHRLRRHRRQPDRDRPALGVVCGPAAVGAVVCGVSVVSSQWCNDEGRRQWRSATPSAV